MTNKSVTVGYAIDPKSYFSTIREIPPKRLETIRQLLKIAFWMWGTTTAIVVFFTFMQAKIYGNEIIVQINNLGEANIEYWIINILGSIALLGGIIIFVEFLQHINKILEETRW